MYADERTIPIIIEKEEKTRKKRRNSCYLFDNPGGVSL